MAYIPPEYDSSLWKDIANKDQTTTNKDQTTPNKDQTTTNKDQNSSNKDQTTTNKDQTTTNNPKTDSLYRGRYTLNINHDKNQQNTAFSNNFNNINGLNEFHHVRNNLRGVKDKNTSSISNTNGNNHRIYRTQKIFHVGSNSSHHNQLVNNQNRSSKMYSRIIPISREDTDNSAYQKSPVVSKVEDQYKSIQMKTPSKKSRIFSITDAELDKTSQFPVDHEDNGNTSDNSNIDGANSAQLYQSNNNDNEDSVPSNSSLLKCEERKMTISSLNSLVLVICALCYLQAIIAVDTCNSIVTIIMRSSLFLATIFSSCTILLRNFHAKSIRNLNIVLFAFAIVGHILSGLHMSTTIEMGKISAADHDTGHPIEENHHGDFSHLAKKAKDAELKNGHHAVLEKKKAELGEVKAQNLKHVDYDELGRKSAEEREAQDAELKNGHHAVLDKKKAEQGEVKAQNLKHIDYDELGRKSFEEREAQGAELKNGHHALLDKKKAELGEVKAAELKNVYHAMLEEKKAKLKHGDAHDTEGDNNGQCISLDDDEDDEDLHHEGEDIYMPIKFLYLVFCLTTIFFLLEALRLTLTLEYE